MIRTTLPEAELIILMVLEAWLKPDCVCCQYVPKWCCLSCLTDILKTKRGWCMLPPRVTGMAESRYRHAAELLDSGLIVFTPHS